MLIRSDLVIDLIMKLQEIIDRTQKNKSKKTLISFKELWEIKKPILTAISELK